ncbi:MAG: dTDP-4-dehydrorhamnose reductase [Alphaproteobacteria bacterium]|nr:dTDP-4-dehydrorhamnose reductase [Alphaproteobacteria bacterium]
MPRKIFIAGENGQVAKALARTYRTRGDMVKSAGRGTVDVANEAATLRAIVDFKPDLVINAAAYTAVDKAEDEVEQAYKVNRDGARHVASAARAAGAPLVHISTDYVFDGGKKSPYVESDPTNPIGVYGKSKLAGEAAVAAATPDHVILRTSWVCSPDGNNFVKTMLRLASERDELSVVDDQWGAPTFAADLADAIASIGEKLLTTSNRQSLHGIYHATGTGETTWCRFARAIMEKSAARGGPSCRVRAIPSSDYPTRARRPENSRLDCSKLAQSFGLRLPEWQTSLDRCLDQLIAANYGASV